VVALVLLALPSLAFATQWTVDVSAAPGGNGSPQKPFNTLNQVLPVLATGDTVLVHTGTYNETVNFWQVQQGSGSRTTIKAAPGASPIIDGGGSATFVLQAGETAQMTFEGLTVRNATGVGIMFHKASGGQVVSCTTQNVGVGVNFYYSNSGEVTGSDLFGGVAGKASDGITVKSCKIHDGKVNGLYLHADSKNCSYVGNVVHNNTPNNIYIDTASNMTVDRNLIYFSGTPPAEHAGIMMGDEVYPNVTSPRLDNITITNNVMINNRYGILFWQGDYPGQSGMKNVRIANNTVINSVETALVWDPGPHSAVVQNNIFADDGKGNASMLVMAKSTTGVTLDHNLWDIPWVPNFVHWGGSPMTHYAWKQASGQGANDVLGDPKLAGPWTQPAANAKLQSGSPAIDKGAALAFVTHDFDGTTRPVGAGHDIGAFETGGTPPPPDGGPKPDGTQPGDSRPHPGTDGPHAADHGGSSTDDTSPGGSDDGCGCRLQPRAGETGGSLLLLALAVLGLVRRRRAA